MMSIPPRLPNEILLDVFERLRVSPSDLTNAMKCCRRWNSIAGTVLYRNIDMDSKLREDTSCSRFCRFATQCDLVQTFSLRVSQAHLMGFSILSADAFDRLTELCEVLGRMRNLRTFTLSFEEPEGQGFTAPSIAIVSILRSLPKTVVNLNLDCDRMCSPDLQQPHVCHALGALLPRLRSLRLRSSHLCSGMLSEISPQATLDSERTQDTKVKTTPNATSALEYLIIQLVNRPGSEHGAHTALCFSGHDSLKGAKLADTLQHLHRAGAFPSLRKFAIIGRVDAPTTPRNDHWSVFKVRTFSKTSRKTTTFPWCARGGSSSLYMIRDQEGDWFGSFDDIVHALEGPLAWSNTGIRPNDAQSHGHNRTWNLDLSRLASREMVIENFGVSFRLWKHEEATKMKLLDVRTAIGFDDTTAISQVIPYGWQWVREGPWTWTIEPIATA